MDKEYKPEIIEKNIQKYWDNNNAFVSDLNDVSNKFYCLSMFPYPSGKLHIGPDGLKLSEKVEKYIEK